MMMNDDNDVNDDDEEEDEVRMRMRMRMKMNDDDDVAHATSAPERPRCLIVCLSMMFVL